MKFKAPTHDGVDVDTLFCQMETKRRTDASGHCSPATGFVCAAFDLLLRSNEEENKRGWIEVFFFFGSHRETDLAGRLTPALVIITWSASEQICVSRPERKRRRGGMKGRKEERRAEAVYKLKKRKNPLLCLSPSYQRSLTRGGGEDGRNSGESSLLNTQ